MAKRDLIDELVDLIYPRPDRAAMQLGDDILDTDPGSADDAWDAACEWAEQQRRELEDNLRAAEEGSPIVLAPGDVPVNVDPVTRELQRAQADRQNAEERLRRLLAYAREFMPRPRPLAELGLAAGISGSGVRTFYSSTDVGQVARLLGRTPNSIQGLRAGLGSDECAVIGGKRNQQAISCANVPTVIGGAPHTDQRFRVCTAHSYLVSDPQPITAV